DVANLDAFLALPFWTTEHVGLGPYKLDRWEPGSVLEGVAFSGHALGAPKISRLIIHPVPDENTIMTNVMPVSMAIAGNVSLRYEQAKAHRGQWHANQGETIFLNPGRRPWVVFKFRQDLIKTKALMDLRVRRAMSPATDRGPINEALFDGQGAMS